jgi:glycerophosphoryl diester phosphodiesterase
MKLTLKNLSMAIMMSGMIMGSSAMAADSNEKIVIAHRGASGYLPEHTLPAKAMAYAQGADYLEQDLVMTKDDHLVVLHDHYLDRVTDVADRFPDRARKDGRYYAIDFTLDEIKSLKVSILKTVRKYRLIRGVSRWVNLTSGYTLSKKRLNLFRG